MHFIFWGDSCTFLRFACFNINVRTWYHLNTCLLLEVCIETGEKMYNWHLILSFRIGTSSCLTEWVMQSLYLWVPKQLLDIWKSGGYYCGEKISWKAAVFQLHLCDLVNSCLYSIFSSSLRSCQGVSILAHQVLGVLSESKGTRSLSRGGKAGLLVTMQRNTPWWDLSHCLVWAMKTVTSATEVSYLLCFCIVRVV